MFCLFFALNIAGAWAAYGAGWAWNAPECGTVSAKHPSSVRIQGGQITGTKGRIVGGEEAAAHSYPWQIYLHIKLDDGRYTSCGGSILNNKWVLTAAHCVDDGSGAPQDANFLWRMARHLTVYAGIHQRDVNNAQKREFMPGDKSTQKICGVSQVKIFKGWPGAYKQSTYFHPGKDMALLKLDCYLRWTDEIRPVCLADKGVSFFTDRKMVLTGWGKTGDYELGSKVLKQIVVNVDGEYYYEKNMISLAGDQYGACVGDSGGPANAYRDGKWYVAGIATLVKGDLTGAVCNAQQGESIYTTPGADQYIGWIQKELVNM